jgi:hypothetical protein
MSCQFRALQGNLGMCGRSGSDKGLPVLDYNSRFLVNAMLHQPLSNRLAGKASFAANRAAHNVETLICLAFAIKQYSAGVNDELHGNLILTDFTSKPFPLVDQDLVQTTVIIFSLLFAYSFSICVRI